MRERRSRPSRSVPSGYAQLPRSSQTGGRKRFRGEVLAAGDEGFSLGADGAEPVLIPYAEVVRGNVIDEG